MASIMTKSVRLLAATRKRDTKTLSCLIVTIWPLTLVFTVAPTCLKYERLFFFWESHKLVVFFNHAFGHKFIQCHPFKIISILNITTYFFRNNSKSSQIKHITLQQRIALFSDNGDDLCYIYQKSTFSYCCVMNRALHYGLNSSIFFKFLHNFAESWSYYKVLLEGMFIARDTDETTFYLHFLCSCLMQWSG